MRWWRPALAALILAALPAAAAAHVIGGTGSWLDELICLVPALALLAAVLFLGRPTPADRGKGKR
ncbi:MAG: hypothetical protein IRY83_13910 [Chloroflexi bacterium]|nr:hypothetical protein [Chloroflexota bacterium]